MPLSPSQKAKKVIQEKKNPSMAMFNAIEELKATANDIIKAELNKVLTDFESRLKGLEGQEVANVMKNIKAMKGEVGEKGIQGDKGESGIDGIDGLDGNDGEPGTQGEIGEKGLNGEKGDIGSLGNQGERGLTGQDGSPDTADEVRDKLQSLTGTSRLDASAIKNLPKGDGGKRGMSRGGGLAANKVDNFTALTDGATKTFTLSAQPKTGTVMLYSTQFPVIYDPDTDFVVSGLTVTLQSGVGAPEAGQTLVATYQKDA